MCYVTHQPVPTTKAYRLAYCGHFTNQRGLRSVIAYYLNEGLLRSSVCACAK